MAFSKRSQRGFSLAVTLVIVTLVGGIASALIILSTNQMGVDQKTRDKVRATYMAEAGVEYMAHLLRKAHANALNLTVPSVVSGGPLTIDGKELDCQDLKVAKAGGGFSAATPGDGIAETVFSEVTIDGQRVKLSAERFLEKPPPVPSDEGYDPLEAQTTTIMYSIVAELRFLTRRETKTEEGQSVDESLRRVHAASLGRVVRVMEFKITPIFDKFAFWDDDLEILPGPPAIFNGRIHTNGSLYIGAGGGLQINTDYIRAKGDMFRHRKDDPAGSAWATVTVRDPYADPYQAQGKLGDNPWVWDPKFESDSDYNPSWNLDDSWLDNVSDPALNGKVRNNDNEAVAKLELEAPSVDIKDVGGYYNQAADIVIQDTTVFQRQGGELVDITSSLPPGTVTSSSVYDARESSDGNPNSSGSGTTVPTTVIDMAKLQANLGFPDNGVIYAYRTNTAEATASAPRVIEGVQLINGSTLASDLTVVTNGPVYVQGDYNVDVPANPSTGAPAKPRKGAAIIGDAVNLLSNGWDNSKKSGGSPPSAKATTYNFALVTGNTPTDLDQKYKYSGGLENLPRFHENWGGVNCNYQGALMCLWPSVISTGRWGKNNVYTPPVRNWDFDARFGDPDSSAKPPLFPQTVSIDRTTYVEGYPTPVEE